MSDYLERACEHLNIDANSVLKSRHEDDEIVIIADYGIGGVKKHRVPTSLLHPPAPEPESEPEQEPEGHVCEGCGREFDSDRGLSVHQRYCSELAADEEE